MKEVDAAVVENSDAVVEAVALEDADEEAEAEEAPEEEDDDEVEDLDEVTELAVNLDLPLQRCRKDLSLTIGVGPEGGLPSSPCSHVAVVLSSLFFLLR